MFQALALSTAALLFMLSRDRQMEINKPTLQLLLRLLDPFDKGDLNANAEKSSKKKSVFAILSVSTLQGDASSYVMPRLREV